MDINRALSDLIKPAVAITPGPVTGSMHGRFGGESDIGWPICGGCGNAQHFILELDFARISQVHYDKHLSLFYCWSCEPEASGIGITVVEGRGSSGRKFSDQRPDWDADFEIKPSGMDFKPVQLVPSPESMYVEHRELRDAMLHGEEPWAVYETFLEQHGIDRFQNSCITPYIYWVEGYSEHTCACGSQMRPFFQAGTHHDINLIWLAEGIMYFFECVRPECSAPPRCEIQGF